jgi:hypothetical protein
MTVLTAAAVLGLIVNPACGNLPGDSDLAQHLVATVITESGGDPFIIGVNADTVRGLPASKVSAPTAAEAAAKASMLLAQGRSIDLGLTQISDRQMPRHHLTLATAFDQCANIRAGAEHLADDHAWVLAHRRYNCGDITCGVAYANDVTARIRALDGTIPVTAAPSPPPPCAPAWDAWGLAACGKQPTGSHNETATEQETTHAN